MKSKLLFPLCLLCAVITSQAQDFAKARLDKSPRHGEWVTVTNGARHVQCFVVYPEVPDKATSVLLIHEIFGLSDWARSEADEFAEAGYIAIAPDLLSGYGPNGGKTSDFSGSDAVRNAIFNLPPDQITGDLNAAADYAKQLPAANGKLVVAGFCWGGTETFRYACNRPDIKAAFVFYGTAPKNTNDLAKIQCPVYGFYAGNDARVSSTIDDTVAKMKAAGKTCEPVKYPGAGHGYMRAGDDPAGSAANKAARDQSWTRLKDLLKGI